MYHDVMGTAMTHKKPLKFELICSDLRSRIIADEFLNEQKLPSEKLLAETYHCSRPTLRKALRQLQDQNYIYKVQGSGSYVAKKPQGEMYDNGQQRQNSMFFGLIFPNLGIGYVFDSICNQIANIISQAGYSTIWGGYLSPESKEFKNQIINICNNYKQLGVQGVFFSPFEYTELRDEVNHYILSTLRKAGIPVVLIDSDVEDFPFRSNFDLVSLDHTQTSYNITTHMLDQGIERLIFLAPPLSMHTIKMRRIGYHEALMDKGLTPLFDWYQEISPADDEAVKTLIEELHPEGILCSNDGTAITLMNTLQRLGLAIPGDIIIGGFDNLSYLSNIKIPLTSISQPAHEISRIAVELMFDRINDPNRMCRTIRLPGKLVVRNSTQRST